jgi:hypothetical protein
VAVDRGRLGRERGAREQREADGRGRVWGEQREVQGAPWMAPTNSRKQMVRRGAGPAARLAASIVVEVVEGPQLGGGGAYAVGLKVRVLDGPRRSIQRARAT